MQHFAQSFREGERIVFILCVVETTTFTSAKNYTRIAFPSIVRLPLLVDDKSMRVLIADDSRLLVERLKVVLDKVPDIKIVGQAETGAEAFEAIRTLAPDVVILDLCMPGGSGIDVLNGIRRDQLNCIVIVLTGYGEPQYRKRCLEGGATYFLDKATEFETVADVLRNLAAGARATAEINPEARDEEEGNASVAEFCGAAPPATERAAIAEKPKLIVSNSNKGEPIYYTCSRCLRGFPFPDHTSPKEAVRELYQRFREHVEKEHADPVNGPIIASAA